MYMYVCMMDWVYWIWYNIGGYNLVCIISMVYCILVLSWDIIYNIKQNWENNIILQHDRKQSIYINTNNRCCVEGKMDGYIGGYRVGGDGGNMGDSIDGTNYSLLNYIDFDLLLNVLMDNKLIVGSMIGCGYYIWYVCMRPEGYRFIVYNSSVFNELILYYGIKMLNIVFSFIMVYWINIFCNIIIDIDYSIISNDYIMVGWI